MNGENKNSLFQSRMKRCLFEVLNFWWVLKGIDKCESLRGYMEKINELSFPMNYVVRPTSNWLVYGLWLLFQNLILELMILERHVLFFVFLPLLLVQHSFLNQSIGVDWAALNVIKPPLTFEFCPASIPLPHSIDLMLKCPMLCDSIHL